MWYFTPRSDLLFLERFRALTRDFIAARGTVSSLESNGRRGSRSEADVCIAAIEKRDKLRTQFSQQQVRATWIAKKYKVQVVFAVWIHTVALQQAQVDAFTAINENTVYPEEVQQRAVDTIDRCVGACKDQMREDVWHLVNPLYWIYASFHSLFTSSGLSKPLGEPVTKLVSKALTAGIVAATPWLKQLAAAWLKRLTG
jgi:hypothetical protein